MVHKKLLKSSLVIMLVVAMLFSTVAVLQRVFASENGWTARAHVQQDGWLNEVTELEVLDEKPADDAEVVTIIGTMGESKSVEALDINVPEDVTLNYRAHVAFDGWGQGWRTADGKLISKDATSADTSENDETVVGTVGQSKQMEAVQIAVSGDGVADYDVYYRAHVSMEGWLPWVKALDATEEAEPEAEEFAGTVGKSEQLEALEVVLVLNETARAKLLEEKISEAVTSFQSWYENDQDLKKTVPGTDVDYVSTVNGAIAEGFGMINGATSLDEVETKLQEAKDNVIDALQDEVEHLLGIVYNEGNAYQDKVLTEENYNKYLEQSQNADTTKGKIDAYEEALASRHDFTPVLAEIAEKLTDYVEGSALKTTVPGGTMDFAAVPAINDAIVAGYSAIYASESEKAANEAYDATVANIVSATKEYAQFLLDSIYNDGLGYTWEEDDSESRLILSEENYDVYTTKIEEATDVATAINAYVEALGKRELVDDIDLFTAKKVAKESLNKYNGGAENYTLNADAYEAAIEAGETAIDEAESVQDVATELLSAKSAIDKILNDEQEKARIEERKTECVNLLTKYVEKSKLKTIVPGGEIDFAAVPEINEEIVAGYTNINAAETYDEVTTATREARINILVATKDYVKYLLGVLYNGGTAYYDLVLDTNTYNSTIKTIEEVSEKNVWTNSEVDSVVQAYLDALNERKTLEEVRRAEKVEFLLSYCGNADNLCVSVPGKSGTLAENIAGIGELITSTNKAIEESKSIVEMKQLVENAHKQMVTKTQEYIKTLLKDLRDNVDLTQKVYEVALRAVNKATTINDIRDAYKTAYGKRIIKTTVNDVAALKNALTQQTNDAVITLDQDVTIDSSNKLDISGDRNVTINLAGKTIKGEEEKENLIKVEEGASLTISGGKITTNTDSSPSNSKYAIRNNGNLTLNNVSIEGEYGIVTNGGELTIDGKNSASIKTEGTGVVAVGNNAKISIKDITIESSNAYAFTANGAFEGETIEFTNCTLTQSGNNLDSVYLAAGGTAVFNNCIVTGGSAIETRGCSVTINGGTYTGKESTRFQLSDAIGKSCSNGSAILVLSNSGCQQDKTIVVTISEGTKVTTTTDQCYPVEVHEATGKPGAKIKLTLPATMEYHSDVTTDNLLTVTGGSKKQ